MGLQQLYNDNLRKLLNEYGDVSVMLKMLTTDAWLYYKLTYEPLAQVS